MTWQSFKQAWLIRFWSPVPAVIAAGILSTYYFGITGTFWAVTGEFTRWGGQLLQTAGRPQRTVGLLPADTSRRVAADPHRWQDDHRHVRRLPGRRAVGE